MDYTSMTKEELLEVVSELKILNDQLLLEQRQSTDLNYSWTGNLGHWYWHVPTNKVICNPHKLSALGFDISEVPNPLTYQFFTDRLHPDDHEMTMTAMLDHMYHGTKVYEVEYRILCKDGSYRWFYDRGSITKRDKSGKPVFLAGIVFDITDRKEKQKQLEQDNIVLLEKTRKDEMTGIHNHRAVVEFLNDQMAISIQTKQPLSVAMIDIDDFKKVNDQYGHVVGDEVLRQTAQIIADSVRETDLVGRYGGEEYLVVFSQTKKRDAEKVLSRILSKIREFQYEQGFCVTVSAGISQYNNETLSEFVARADKCMYEAKKAGKDRIFFD